MNWLKDILNRWKVQISVVGGVVVIATAWGTCNYEAPASGDAVEVPEGATPATTETTGTTTTTENTDTTGTTTTETTDTTTTETE